MTLTNGGEGENDINIDLGKELQGEMEDGTSKFQEEEGNADQSENPNAAKPNQDNSQQQQSIVNS